MQSVIRVENLLKKYQDKTAVNGISFEVRQGQCFGLLGPNGAGKTTTIEMLEGMVKPDAGEIFYGERPINRDTLKSIGIQFQQTALQDYLTARETIEMFRALYPTPLATDDLVSLCQLEAFLEQDHRKLSGGQKQRLLLALALVNDPDILFLDEPTTGLDPQARRNFWDLIRSIKARGKTIVLTTHYMDEAEKLCDTIVVMDNGNIIERGEPHGLLNTHFPGVLIRLPQDAMGDSLRTRFSVLDVDRSIELTTHSIEQTLKDLLAAGVDLAGIQVRTANLDDLFLKLTGHALRESNV